MKRSLLLPVLLAACAQPAQPPLTFDLSPLHVIEGRTSTTVTTGAGVTFTWTDNRGYRITNNIYPNTPKTLPSGSDFGLKIEIGP